jgi:hypothetical protein
VERQDSGTQIAAKRAGRRSFGTAHHQRWRDTPQQTQRLRSPDKWDARFDRPQAVEPGFPFYEDAKLLLGGNFASLGAKRHF